YLNRFGRAGFASRGPVGIAAYVFNRTHLNLTQLLAQLACQAIEGRLARPAAASRQNQRRGRMLLAAQQDSPIPYGEQPNLVVIGHGHYCRTCNLRYPPGTKRLPSVTPSGATAPSSAANCRGVMLPSSVSPTAQTTL